MFDQEIDLANQRLKGSGCRLKIEQRRESLVLRGVLPPKPGSAELTPKQQRIPVGAKASVAGIKRAMALAQKIDAEVTLGTFRWQDHVAETSTRDTAGSIIQRFEQHYWASREKTIQTQESWKTSYWEVYKRFEPDGVLTEKTARQLMLRTEPDTRSRVRYHDALVKLLKFAGLPYDIDLWKDLKGSYNTNEPKPRKLLSDEEIIEVWRGLDDVVTAYAWGLMATFGLRTHELWHLNTAPLLKGENYVVVGSQTKAKKERRAYALPVEWIDMLELRIDWDLCAPEGISNQRLGRRIASRFSVRGLPAPYTLRHCYRARAFRSQIDPVAAARSMGHSVMISQKHYTRWIEERDIAKAFEQDL